MRFKTNVATVIAAAALLVAPIAAVAATDVRGLVVDTSNRPVAGAAIRIERIASTKSDDRGAFVLPRLPNGTFAATISAAGFLPQTVRFTVGRSSEPLRVVLLPLPALRTIGSVVSHSRSTFNDTPAAVKIFPREAYRDQSQPDLGSVLAQTPGALPAFAQSENAAVRGVPVFASIRGSLPFETATAIDGVVVSLPSTDTFDLATVPSFVLQDVEIDKAPGDVGNIAAGAIAGMLNLRTAEPTVTRRALLEFGVDDRGGSFDDLWYGGTMPGGKLSIATMFATDGSTGPLANAAYPIVVSKSTGDRLPIVNGNLTTQGSSLETAQLVGCCVTPASDDLRRAQFFKLAYKPSGALVITLGYLGTQTDRALAGAEGMLLPLSIDGTPATVFASLAPTLDARERATFGLYDLDAQIDVRNDAFDLRAYLVNSRRNDDFSPQGTLALDLTGTATYENGSTQTFDNTPASVMLASVGEDDTYADRIAGARAGWQHQGGKNAYLASIELRGAAANGPELATTATSFDTLANLSAQLHPNARTEIDLGGGLDARTAQFAPFSYAPLERRSWSAISARAAGSYRLGEGVALRASAGTSSAAPPLEALSSGQSSIASGHIGLPAQLAFVRTNPNLALETASSYDLGLEWRLHGNTTTVSADAYRTITHGAFLEQTSFDSLCTTCYYALWTNGPPIEESGIEASAVQFKRVGLGAIAQIALLRTFAIGNLPSAFYADNSNLSTLPAQNIAGGGFFVSGYNDIANMRVPYAQGYGEISYKWPRGSRLSFGGLFEGANNPYNRPAFATFNANLELSLGGKQKLQISAENIFGALNESLPLAFGGIGAPTVLGTIAGTNANVLPPPTIRFVFRQSLGTGSVYER
jgi:hypothetical protein